MFTTFANHFFEILFSILSFSQNLRAAIEALELTKMPNKKGKRKAAKAKAAVARQHSVAELNQALENAIVNNIVSSNDARGMSA
jgi:hypothetical protein